MDLGDVRDPAVGLVDWLPLSGQTLHRVGRRIVAVGGTDGVALAPRAPLSMVAAGRAETVILRLDPKAFAAELAARCPRANPDAAGGTGCRIVTGEWSARLLDLLGQWSSRLDDDSSVPDVTSVHVEAAITSLVARAVVSDGEGGAHSSTPGGVSSVGPRT